MKFHLFFLFIGWCLITPCTAFEKVVIWGHKLHTHTHSYIHYAFYKTFRHLGYETYWFDDQQNGSTDFDFSNTLFITEGQVDQNIPIREDCFYILHNCDSQKYLHLSKKNRIAFIQTYKNTSRQHCPKAIEVEPCILYDIENRTLYMPWATDLLPEEIDAVKEKARQGFTRKPFVFWVGSIGSGLYGNIDQISLFNKACTENGVNFVHIDPWSRPVSAFENKRLIQESFISPTIVGKWQKENGYIPCRIFKNISYGQFGVTNSKDVFDLFKGMIVYHSDEYQLYFDAVKKIQEATFDELERQMDFVKDHHTYINRIHTILDFISLCQTQEQN